MRSTKLAASLLLLVATATSSTLADGLIRDGVGSISTGRGGVNLAYADNGAVILDNPAGMSNVRGGGLMDLGLDTVICDLDYSDPDNPAAEHSVNGYPLPMVGYVNRVPDSCWSYGLGVFAPAGFGSGYDLNNPITGPAHYKSFGALVKILPGVSYELTDRLAIGGTFGLALSHVELEGPFTIQTGAFAGAPTLLDLQATGAAPTGSLGLQYKWTEDTVIGLAYTEETRFVMNGNARATLITGLGPLDSAFDAETDIVWPRSLGIGLMHQFCCCSRLGMDVVWYDWSHAFSEMPITFRDPTNPVVGAVLGNEFRDVFPMNWHDSVSYRFGYDWSPTDDFTGRLGYVYHRSPVDGSTLNPYLDGILEHAVSAGLSHCMCGAWVNLSYQYSWSPNREVGNSAIVGGDFDNSTLRANAHWIGVSVLTNW
jgi:long-subunit fatty acid transport protein